MNARINAILHQVHKERERERERAGQDGTYAALCHVTSSQASRSYRRRVASDTGNKQSLQRGQTLIASKMFPHFARSMEETRASISIFASLVDPPRVN